MPQPLVSVLSPCYNVGPYIDRFIDSLIAQTYKNLEIIFINDGSTDNTLEIIERRKIELQTEGYHVTIVSQENEGLSSAINLGLKHFTGDYLTWPDPDDWLAPTSIEGRIRIFENHPYIGTVRCNAQKIDDETHKSLGHFFEPSDSIFINDSLFDDLANIRTYFAPVCYMVRSAHFLAINPEREIYASRVAMQNLQMLLPITYAYKTMQTNKVLASYLVRKKSLSRSSQTDYDVFRWDSVMCDVSIRTLRQIKGLDVGYLTNISQYFICTKLAPGAFRARMKAELTSLLYQLNLSPLKRALCTVLTWNRMSVWSRTIDRLAFGFSSKIENRVFRRILADGSHSRHNASQK